MAKKKREYCCSQKVCPRPADFAQFPELMRYVRAEWRTRMERCASGQARKERAAMEARYPPFRKPSGRKGK